jgi:hypothetical protein
LAAIENSRQATIDAMIQAINGTHQRMGKYAEK